MSGYCKKCGIYEITGSKIGFWNRRTDEQVLQLFPSRDWKTEGPVGVVDILQACGLEVVKDGGNYLHVRGTPGQVWEALSGRPSNPNHYVSEQRSCPYCKKGNAS